MSFNGEQSKVGDVRIAINCNFIAQIASLLEMARNALIPTEAVFVVRLAVQLHM